MVDLASRVALALDELCKQPDERQWGDSGWTRRVKNTLIRLAHDAGQRAYASQADGADGGEWLYDLTWLDYSPEERVLTRTILVLESEWSWDLNQIKSDFHKLLLARADLRLMVFQVKNDDQWKRVVDRLINLIKLCEQSEDCDRYLLSSWRSDSRTFRHLPYVHGPA